MEEVKEEYKVIMNPYVTQAERFAVSLHHLGEKFLKIEEPKEQFSEEEISVMCELVVDKVCKSCENRGMCMKGEKEHIHQMIREILCTVEIYGIDLNMEMKKRLQKECILAPRFLRETLETFQNAKREMLWQNKMIQNRENCAIQLDEFAQMIRHTMRELDASIFQDPPLEKKIRGHLRRVGVRLLSSVFFVNPKGRYEIHVTAKTEKGHCVPTKVVAQILSKSTGRRMCLAQGERTMVGQEYGTMVYVEGPRFYTMQGIARIGKDCDKISGDSFAMMSLPGGQEAAILSDGMGSGEKALKESTMVIEMLEELLQAGFPKETAFSMMNTAMVMGREEVCFSTLDLSVFDLYTGNCEFLKAGAAPTFIRKEDKMEHIYSESLPLGVMRGQKIEKSSHQLSSGDMVVMVTDGVLDALPAGEQQKLLDLMILGSTITNPKEMAHYILEKVLELGGDPPGDDMTVLVAGIWHICYN
ncbi:MAG: SpoIIE family protein phosphatase [bacterium]|nr:SpoIIE family protein phosphatase [bacterium]